MLHLPNGLVIPVQHMLQISIINQAYNVRAVYVLVIIFQTTSFNQGCP